MTKLTFKNLYDFFHMIYCFGYDSGNKRTNDLRALTGWKVVAIPGTNSFLTTKTIYKDNIFIYRSNDSMIISVGNDEYDNDPLCIYETSEHNFSSAEGWGNINEWSLFAYQIITESFSIVEDYDKKIIVKEMKKDFKRTNEFKPEALAIIKKKLKMKPEEKINLLVEMKDDSKLQDYLIYEEKKLARDIANKLSKKD